MIQRFLLDRILAETSRPAIASKHDLTTPSLAHKAEGLLAFVQFAITRT